MIAKYQRQPRRRPAELRPHGADRQRRRRLPRAALRAVQHRPRRPAAVLHRRRIGTPEARAAPRRAAAASWRTSSPRSTRPSRSRATALAKERAWRLLRAKAVFDISKEWPKAKDRYGDTEFGRGCFLARKLVEAGVPFVEVGQDNYDSHADNFVCHKANMQVLDPAWSALLARPGGARPAATTRWSCGWARSAARRRSTTGPAATTSSARWTIVLAGGGIKGGQVVRRDRRRRQGGEGQPGERGRPVRDDLHHAGHQPAGKALRRHAAGLGHSGGERGDQGTDCLTNVRHVTNVPGPDGPFVTGTLINVTTAPRLGASHPLCGAGIMMSETSNRTLHSHAPPAAAACG